MEGFQDIEHFVKSLYAAIKKKIPTKVSQLTNDAGYKTTDTNTTYKLSKSGSTVILTGSDGSTTSVTDSNTTYSSLKNPYSLTIQNNGNTVASYDGSTAKTANFMNATSSADGLMSAADKKAVDREFFRMLPKGGTHIPANADLNSLEYIRVGNYYNSLDVESKTIKNIPLASAFMMYVLSPLSEVYDNEKTSQWVYRLRILVNYRGENVFIQFVSSGATKGEFTYNAWLKLTNSKDLAAVSNIINAHIGNKANPHAVTKAQVGLGSVANIDQSKAIKSITRSGTTFTATALDGTKTTFTQQDSNTTYSVATTCNILADNWVQDKTSLLYSNAVSVAGVKEGYVYDIDAYKGNLATSAEVEAYNNDFSCISGGYAEAEEGKITFTVVDKPAANITVRVKGTQVITTEETQSDEINNQKSTITDLQSKLAKITDKIYPVGSIYISVNSTSPADLFGGTWERLKKVFLFAADDDQYTVGSSGGEETHTLTVDEMPSHRHSSSSYQNGYPTNYTNADTYVTWANTGTPNNNNVNTDQSGPVRTSYVGGSKSHNNMPPYVTAYMWKRVA